MAIFCFYNSTRECVYFLQTINILIASSSFLPSSLPPFLPFSFLLFSLETSMFQNREKLYNRKMFWIYFSQYVNKWTLLKKIKLFNLLGINLNNGQKS